MFPRNVPGARDMIQLTRLNNQGLLVNCDLIKFVESAPDTVLTLVSGEKIVVRESSREVLEKIIGFRRMVMWCDPSAEKQPEHNSVTLANSDEGEQSAGTERGPDRG